MGRSLDSCEAHTGKCVDILRGPMRGNMDIKGVIWGLRRKRRAAERGSVTLEEAHRHARNGGGNMNVEAG